MKHAFLLSVFVALCLFGFAQDTSEQEKLDLPGDNLNLYAVMKIFQESPTLEEFEKSLNDQNNRINNLDLDGDGKTDYIKVIDNVDGDTHSIALRVAINQNEDQDVAVFAVQKDNNGQVQIQLIGDEDLYGKDYIVEPNYESTDNTDGTPNPGYIPPPATELDQEIQVQTTTPAQIATWNVVRFIYVPNYVAWRSPWRWGYYPSYWRPWNPFYWHEYYGYHYHWDYFYFGHYRRWRYYRFPAWRNNYYRPGFRATSPFVQARFKRGGYRTTYSRPDLAKQGASLFKKDFPKAPSIHDKLPGFDKTGRPIHVRPVDRPSLTKPAITHPITRPAPKPVTRPVITEPVKRPTPIPITKPVIKEPVIRPTPRPVVPEQPVHRPVHKPVTRPVVRPVHKPTVNPTVRPGIAKPLPGDKSIRR